MKNGSIPTRSASRLEVSGQKETAISAAPSSAVARPSRGEAQT